MMRRLRIAGTAFGAILLPACATIPPDAPAVRPASKVPAPVPVGYRPMPGSILPTVTPAMAAKPKMIDKFAEGRTVTVPTPAERLITTPAKAPAETIIPVDHKVAAPPTATVEAPRLMHPAFAGPSAAPPPEPTPDAEGVIRPHWPVIAGTPRVAEPIEADTNPGLVLPPPGELLKSVAPDMAPPAVIPPAVAEPAPAPPPPLPPGVIGSSVHHSHASPAGTTAAEQTLNTEPVMAAAVTMAKPSPVAAESPLLRAVQAFQQNRPDEAVEHLKAYDPATQQVLLSLMPAIVRLSEGKLQSMKPEEMDVLLDQLTRVPNMLRPRASLRADNVRLCRQVHNFAHVEPFPDRHTFRPGDIVYLYMELSNFSCAPDPKGGFSVTLVSSLELKDAAGSVVWRADPKESADHVSTPPHDYYRNFRLSIPAVPPGAYTLTVKTTDRPTGRDVQKVVEVRIGAR